MWYYVKIYYVDVNSIKRESRHDTIFEKGFEFDNRSFKNIIPFFTQILGDIRETHSLQNTRQSEIIWYSYGFDNLVVSWILGHLRSVKRKLYPSEQTIMSVCEPDDITQCKLFLKCEGILACRRRIIYLLTKLPCTLTHYTQHE